MIAIDVAFAVLGVVLMSVAVSGYFQRALSVWVRVAVGAAGLVTLLPHAMLLAATLRQGAPTSLSKCVFGDVSSIRFCNLVSDLNLHP